MWVEEDHGHTQLLIAVIGESQTGKDCRVAISIFAEGAEKSAETTRGPAITPWFTPEPVPP